jgi:predicted heme/steroid binding protein
MRKALIISIVLFGVFLAIGCAGNKPVTPNETVTPEQTVTPAQAVTEAVTPAGEQVNTSQTTAEMQNATVSPPTKEFTLNELAQFNGKNGKAAYVAYQGVVYDVSNSVLWKNGDHKGHSAGKDLTEEMSKATHIPGIIKGFPVVGTLKQ